MKQKSTRIAAEQFVGTQVTPTAPAIVKLMVGIAVFEDVTPIVLNILLIVIACSEEAKNLLSEFISKMRDRKQQCSVIFNACH